MLRKASATVCLIIGGLVGAYNVIFALAAWNEWQCGMNTFNLAFLSAVAVVLLPVGAVLYRPLVPGGLQSRWIFLPLLVFGGFELFLFSGLLPECPYLAR